jgi:4,5-DOPA dioxygenase extradiol
MQRRQIIKLLSILPLTGVAMKLSHLENITKTFDTTETMPVLFVGHGSPMNAIENNEYTKAWQVMSKSLPKPNAIVCISAHWETKGTYVTAMEKPQTIHDFGGFPQALFDVQYPAPGNPELAMETKKLITKAEVGMDEKWGLDHGAWSVIKVMYPDADIPVIQLSLDYNLKPQFHYDLAKELAPLRKKGVLILGSGNMVHNLGMLNWNKPDGGFDWSQTANEKFKKLILDNDHSSLINYRNLGREVELAVPSPEHYLPLLYSLALKTQNEEVAFFNDKYVMGSLSMTSVKIG